MFLKNLFVSLLGISSLASAWAGSDLVVRHIGSASLNKDAFSFSIGLEVSNIGDTAFSGPLKLKPFILPKVDVNSLNGFKGVQFETSIAFVNIAAGQSQVVHYYSNNLPNIPAANYWIGAAVVGENDSNVNNNITNQLLTLGQFSNVAPSPLLTAVDIYSDVRSQINPVNGNANHPWRLTWRGDRDGQRMRVLFSMFDPSRGYVYPSTYEKGVGWVNMGRDYDEMGRLNNYDVYNQGPDFNMAAPGDLFMLTLANYTENAFEFDHSNNLDARKFHASYISQKPSIEIWKTYIEEDPIPFHETVQLNSAYETAKSWEFNRGNLPEGLVINTASGNTSPSFQVMFNYENWVVDYGVYNYSGSIAVKNAANVIEQKNVNFMISKYVGGTQPVLEADASVSVSAISPFAPAPYTYAIKNNGQLPMRFKLEKNNDWMFLSVTQGTIAPGATKNVTITFSPIGRELGNSAGSFVIYNNSVDSAKLINVTYVDKAPNAP